NLTRCVHQRSGRRVFLEHQALEAGANHLIRAQRRLHNARRRGAHNDALRVREFHWGGFTRPGSPVNWGRLFDDSDQFRGAWEGFGDAQLKIALGVEGVMEYGDQFLLEVSLHIDKYVAARNEIEPGKRRIVDEVVW